MDKVLKTREPAEPMRSDGLPVCFAVLLEGTAGPL
jgi:hypothetical protein